MGPFNNFASEVIAVALGCSPAPPVDLFHVADKLDVAEILSTSFRDGFTDFSSPRPVIYLNKVEQIPRMRFVLAHELAHVMLRERAVIKLIEDIGRSCLLPGEENLADEIAGTLLMPDSLIDPFRHVYATLEELEQIADRAAVTPVMVVTRLADAGIDVGLLHWRRGNSSWHVVDRPGAPAVLHGHISISKASSSLLDSLGRHESPIIVGCQIGRRSVEIRGSGWRKRDDVIQLIAPSRDLSFLPLSTRGSSVIDSSPSVETRARPDVVCGNSSKATKMTVRLAN